VAAFYLDNDVSTRVGDHLRQFGHEATHSRDLHQRSAYDEVQLITALDLQAALVTHNYKDFIMLHRAWDLWRARWGISELHTSILVLPQGPEARLADYVMLLLADGAPAANTLYRYRPSLGRWQAE